MWIAGAQPTAPGPSLHSARSQSTRARGVLARGVLAFPSLPLRHVRVAAQNEPKGAARSRAPAGPRVGGGVARDDLDDRLPQHSRELFALPRALKAELGLEREGREPFLLPRRFLPSTDQVNLHLREESQEILGALGIRDAFPVGLQRAEQLGGEDVRPRGRHIALLEHVSPAPSARAAQEPRSRQLSHMVIDPLARKPKPPPQLRGGDRLSSQAQDAQPQGMQEAARVVSVRDALKLRGGRG